MEVMDGESRVRWERVLLVVAALVGLVAMHSIIGPSHDSAMQAPPSLSLMASPVATDVHSGSEIVPSPPGGHVGTAMTHPDGSDGGPMSPMSMPHALMHLCLAVMAAGIVLGLLAVAGFVAVTPHQRTRVGRVARNGVRPARPPLPTATRLAQLCVLRN